jgi:hypothetical protein
MPETEFKRNIPIAVEIRDTAPHSAPIPVAEHHKPHNLHTGRRATF